MGRPQPEIASPYPPESDPQPQNLDYTPEEGNTYHPEEISSSAYEPQSAYPTGNDAVNQQQFPPPTQDPQPSPYPPQNQTNNASYPPQPAQYPPANPQPAFSTPAGYGTRSPVNFPPPNPSAAGVQQYPPANPQPAFSTPAGYGTPPPVNFPPPNPSAAGVQQYPPPPSPYKPYQQNSAAPGFPVQQPPMQPYRQNPGTAAWNTGLFDCMDDPMNAVVTALFPCLTFGQIAEIVDGGHTTCGTSGLIYGAVACCIALPCIYSCTYRTKLRSKYDLVEAPAPDWITHFLCEWCALCQEYRELKIRGLDPDLGWHGNMARQQNNPPQVEMAPPMRQAMMG